jgi:hypothetical protein
MRYLLIMLPSLSGCFSGDDAPPPDLPTADAGRPVPDGGIGNCGESWLLTYSINGNFYITDTTAGMGDADRPLDEGSLVLRVPDDQGAPAEGGAHIVSFSHGERFKITAFGIETDTDVAVRAGPNPCGIASGTVENDTLTWDRCDPNASHGVDKNSWTPDGSAEGPGCLNDYRTRGNVGCTGIMCELGGLEEGSNIQSEDYVQPLQPFVFVQGWNGFNMARTEIPNRTPSRTWFDLSGLLVDQQLSNTPMCVCEN